MQGRHGARLSQEMSKTINSLPTALQSKVDWLPYCLIFRQFMSSPRCFTT